MKYQTNGKQVLAADKGKLLNVAQAADYVTAQLIAEALNAFVPQGSSTKLEKVTDEDKGRRVIYTNRDGSQTPGTVTGASHAMAYIRLNGNNHSHAITFERLEWA